MKSLYIDILTCKCKVKYLRKGLFHVIRFYSNGKKEMEYSFNKDWLQGKYYQWYETGRLMVEGNYKNGKMFGEIIRYRFDDGEIRGKWKYKNNILTHIWNVDTKRWRSA